MEFKRLYKNGYNKAFNVTYDDGVLQDVRFVELLNKYGIIGTFNLNSELMKTEFSWMHESGLEVKRLSVEAAKQLYVGHEVASHSLTHPFFSEETTTEQIFKELIEDKKNLETIFDCEIKGFALPFLYYDDNISNCVKATGFKYCRVSDESNDYNCPTDLYEWKSSIFHTEENLMGFVDGFCRSHNELALCQIVGHTYDLDVFDLWDKIEKVFSIVSNQKDVWFASHGEIAEYIDGMNQARISDSAVFNQSDIDLWFCVNGQKIKVPSNSKVIF